MYEEVCVEIVQRNQKTSSEPSTSWVIILIVVVIGVIIVSVVIFVLVKCFKSKYGRVTATDARFT